MEVRHITYAEIGDGDDLVRDVQDLLKFLVMDDAYPPYR